MKFFGETKHSNTETLRPTNSRRRINLRSGPILAVSVYKMRVMWAMQSIEESLKKNTINWTLTVVNKSLTLNSS